jgi:hypothetical protein
VVARKIGSSVEILMADTPQIRQLMLDPVEGKRFTTDGSGNIWLSEARWQEARVSRRPVDNLLLENGHHHYFPADDRGRIIREKS